MDDERVRKLTLGEAEMFVDNLAKAEEEDAAAVPRRFVEENGLSEEDIEQMQEASLVDEWKAIKIQPEDKYVKYVTEDYQLVQHNVYFGKVLETIEEIGFEVSHVKVMDARARVDMEIVPETPSEFGEERIAMGLRASNSVDASVAARLQAYGMRLVCSNGMMGRALFGSKAMRHIGENIEVEEIANQIQEILPQAKENLGEVISEAMNTEVIHAPTVLEDVGFGGNYQDEVAENFLGDDRWDLYCTTTEVIEHGHKDVQESTRESLHRKANKLLPEVK